MCIGTVETRQISDSRMIRERHRLGPSMFVHNGADALGYLPPKLGRFP